MIKAVKFVSIPVKDQDQALEFYTKKLGFTNYDGPAFRREAALDRTGSDREARPRWFYSRRMGTRIASGLFRT